MADNFQEQKLEKDIQELQKAISDLVQEFDNKWFVKGYQLSIKALYNIDEMKEHKSRAFCKV